MDELEKMLAHFPYEEGNVITGKVMVIDDDESIREALEQTLKRRGYEVALYSTGGDALKSFDDSYSVVVLDAKLPKLDGCEVYQRLKAIHDVPIIFHTAYVGEDSEPYRALEPFDYIMKGEETHLLYDAIDMAVRSDD